MKQRNPSSRAHLRSPQLRPLALSLICAGAAPAMAQVLPTGFTPLAGNVTMSQAANVMTINQGLARGIVNWTSFSIGPGGVVNVVQPGASSVLLNRVTGNELSTIAGQLNANGRIVLVNPSGVLFSQGSTVNVGGLIASTLAMTTSDADFLNPSTTHFSFERADASTASVINNGRITATGGGPVVLMGATVANARIGSDDPDSGRITADGGTVALSSGRKITLDLAGDGLTNIVIATDAMATHANVSNSGTLQADGGRVALMGRSATVGELVVNQRGTVRARTVGTRNGEIFLGGGEDNEVQLTGGTLDATGAATGERGGDIRVLGGKVTVQGLADGTQGVADASGQAGGGSVTVQGYDVALSPNAVLRADGTGSGAGGTISVGTATGAAFAGDAANPLPERESHVQVFGELAARGAGSAAGGSISTSGDFVRINPARVDAGGGAQGGANGKWTVSTGNNLTVDADADMPAYDGAYPSLSFSDVSASAVGAALGRGTDVALSSSRTGDSAGVTFGNGAQVVKNEGGGATLRVDSAGGIAMNSDSAIDARVGALNVDFNADSTGLVAKNAAQVNVGGGNPSFELDYGASINLSGATINANGGNIRFFGQGDAASGRAIGGSVSHSDDSWQDGISLNNSTLTTTGGGQVSLRGQGRTRVDSQDSDTNFVYVGTSGVSLQDSAVQGGSGGVSIDGLASLGGDGVRLGNGTKVSTPGNVTVTGRGVDWTDNTLPAGSIDTTTAVNIDSSSIDAGGDVRIEGTGADLQALTKYLAFAANGRTAGGGNGVALSGSVSAGDGRRIDIVGKAGSAGFTAALDGGGAVVTTPTGIPVYGVAVSADTSQPNPLRTAGGTIALDAQGTDISLRMNTFGSGLGAAPDGAMLSVASATGQGGHISLTGRNVLVEGAQNFDGTLLPASLDASGATGGGSIDIAASNVIALGSNSSLDASAGPAGGSGGTINVISGDTLRAYGSISARGANGGNGGIVETSAPHFALAGLRVDASAQAGTAGQAGTWTIDPYNVTIAHGTASGSLTGDPFVPLANSTVQDGDINAALDKGTSVTITTGTGGLATDGNISFDTLAAIQRTTGGAPVTFQLDAAHNINGSGNSNSIQSTGGALDVVFNAGVGGQGGAISFNGGIATNGGNVTMNADAGASSGSAISLNGTSIDTRTAAGDGGPGGFVQLSGTRSLPPTIFNTVPTVDLTGVTIQSSTGDVSISGIGQHGDGVRIQNGTAPSQILTTSGDISITGIGASYNYSLSPLSVQSVDITGATVIRSVDGNIGIRGLVTPGPLDAPSGGVLVGGTTLVTTLGAGSIDIAGESQANGTGLTVAAGARVSGNNNVVLRASNNGASDAVVLTGTVRAGNVLNLRPGGVDTAGNAVDRTANPITLGGTAANGFAVSADEFSRFDAPTIVAGSNAHAGNIAVVGPLTVPGALALQNTGGGGGIQLGGALTASTLGLVSAGDITQTAAAPITAGTLLARSTGGSVLLDQAANNVSADTLGGGAAGAFRYVDVDTVKLGSVSVTGYDAAGNAPQIVSASSMAADTVFVRTLSGDLLLGTNVSSTNGTDLVAASRFQNTGGYTIAGAPWRVWADTWVGETRGGLAGSGLYPNLYHCAYSGLCAVSIPAGANHFIYAQQPVATVLIGNATRPFGFPNPLFSYLVTGLILGDTGAGFSGALFSPALPGSLPGLYPINGTFTSAEGYRVNVVPGNLLVAGVPDLPRPDALRDLPATWVYDRNIGPPPICFATGPLDGDRASQGGDVLAREWSRVRSRPNLSSCVDTEKRNGCADF